jgi:DNA topoisomerase-1
MAGNMFLLDGNIRLNERKIQDLIHDAEKSARAIHLHYVSDTEPGILRIRTKKGFEYRKGKTVVKDEELLKRIKRLVIPPAWENVWICDREDGHLQVTGIDKKGRKQYRYHPLWNNLRNQTKFYRLYSIGKTLPALRKKLHEHLSLPGLPPEKVLAAVISIMEKTSMRVGSSMYEKLYGSFGITTLKDQHVKIGKEDMMFRFRGKKGVTQNISIRSKRLSRIVKRCRDIPGKELFQYYDEKGGHRSIDSGMVNNYLKNISGNDLTAKDLRTWAGTVKALIAFREMEAGKTAAQIKRNIVAALDCVASHLGNTRSVCKKYYVHPIIISLYENNSLKRYLKENTKCKPFDLECEEKILMKILKREAL